VLDPQRADWYALHRTAYTALSIVVDSICVIACVCVC